MSKQQLMYRMISGETGISAHDMRKGNLSLPQWDRIQDSLIDLRKSKLFIDDTPETTVLEIKAKLKKLIHQEGQLGLVVVDYINIVRSASKFDNTYSAIGEISRDFKALAREINVPLLVLAQLNRNTEGRADKMPSMSDIADSDKIPRDADLVMLLYRNSYYEKKSTYVQNQPRGNTANNQASINNAYGGAEPKDNSAVLLVDKHRNGPTGQVPLEFDEKTTKFSSSSNYRTS